MISKKMMSLLTAVAVSGGAVATAVVAPAVIASEQTMAEQYEPYYEDTVGQGDSNSFYARLKSDLPLPAGTKTLLEGGRENGISYFLSTSGDGDIYFSNSWGIPATGATIRPTVTVIYPDGSAEEISALITLIPPHYDSYSVDYGHVEISPAASATFQLQNEVPPNTEISLLNLPNVTELSNAGWTFSVTEEGYFSVSSPENADGPVALQLFVEYPDGTFETSSVTVNVIPPHAETYSVSYGATAVMGGESLTVTPDQVDLPDGTEITLGDNPELTTNGWDLDVTADGELTATAPAEADGTFTIALTVTYPDGTSEATTAQVIATPAPKDAEPGLDDTEPGNPATETPKPSDPGIPSRPQVGGSSFGSS